MALTPSNVNEEKPWLQYYPEWTAHSLEYEDHTLRDLYPVSYTHLTLPTICSV